MAWKGEERRATPDDMVAMARAVAQEVVEQTAPVVVRQTFTLMGLDASDPIRAQKQFSWLREAVERESDPQTRADRAFVRANRARCESIVGKVILVIVGTATVALTGWTATGLLHWFKVKLGGP